jgi:hypothetical protein
MRRIIPERAFEVAEEARSLDLALDPIAAGPILDLAIESAVNALTDGITVERAAKVVTLVVGARELGVGLGLWHAQNRVFALCRDHPDARAGLQPLLDTLGFAIPPEETR